MTHPREPGSVEAALIECLHLLSEAEIRRATGKSLSTLYRAANPMHDAGLHLTDAAAIDAALLAKGLPSRLIPVARAIKARRLAELGGAPAHDPVHPLERLAEVTAEIGDVAARLREATALTGPGGRSITAAEAAAVLAEVREARAALDAIERDVTAAAVVARAFERARGAA